MSDEVPDILSLNFISQRLSFVEAWKEDLHVKMSSLEDEVAKNRRDVEMLRAKQLEHVQRTESQIMQLTKLYGDFKQQFEIMQASHHQNHILQMAMARMTAKAVGVSDEDIRETVVKAINESAAAERTLR